MKISFSLYVNVVYSYYIHDIFIILDLHFLDILSIILVTG